MGEGALRLICNRESMWNRLCEIQLKAQQGKGPSTFLPSPHHVKIALKTISYVFTLATQSLVSKARQ